MNKTEIFALGIMAGIIIAGCIYALGYLIAFLIKDLL